MSWRGSHVIQPAVGVPRPAGDRAVDDGRPEEAKDQRWNDAAALKSATDDNLDSAGAEQQLVQAEYNLRDSGVARGRRRHDILEPKVGQVADERACRSAVGQAVSPEHPLNGHDCRHHE